MGTIKSDEIYSAVSLSGGVQDIFLLIQPVILSGDKMGFELSSTPAHPPGKEIKSQFFRHGNHKK